jgi:hypothetical protein
MNQRVFEIGNLSIYVELFMNETVVCITAFVFFEQSENPIGLPSTEAKNFSFEIELPVK